jgi:hypothetical protein
MEHIDDSNWRKSSYSGGNGGACVEIGTTTDAVLVRDTKANRTGPVLMFTPRTWAAFAAAVKTGG